MNLAESLLTALKDHGVRQLFGIPGDFALPFFKAAEEAAILPMYTFSHEPAVGFAADAAARFLGAPSAAAVTYGAGALNMVNAIASAYAEKSPVVVISGAPGAREGRAGLLLHHQVKTLDSQFAIYREITCDQARLDDLGRAPEQVARVLRSCITHSRPVYLEVPRDLVFQPCEPVTPLPAAEYDAEAVVACADEIMSRLERARSPVLMVGVEVRRFGLEERVGDLARRLHVPVVTSFMGRGLLAQGATPVLGTYMGIAGQPDLTHLVEESDCLLLVRRDPLGHQPRCLRAAHHPAHGHQRPRRGGLDGLAPVPRRTAGGPRGGDAAADRAAAAAGRGRLAGLPEGPGGGRITHRADRHRAGRQRPVRPPRSHAHGRGRRRLPVHRAGHRTHGDRGTGVLRDHGIRGAGCAGPAGRQRASPDRAGRATAPSR